MVVRCPIRRCRDSWAKPFCRTAGAVAGEWAPEGRVGWVQPIGSGQCRNFSANSWEVYVSGRFCPPGPK
jgi:hypothetical protein